MSEVKTPNQSSVLAKAKADAAAPAAKAQTIKDYIKSLEPQIAKALPSVLTPERFSRIALSAVSNNRALENCTPTSFIASMMQAAQLGLEPNTPLGQAYLIPYENKKKGILECQFQIGYQGLIDLAYRSGEVSYIDAQLVYANDKFEYAYGLEPKLIHIPGDEVTVGEPKYVYAVFHLTNGGKAFKVMSYKRALAHGEKYSKAYGSGPWQTNPEEMCKKTVLKALLKYAPKRSDFVRGVAADETVKNEISDDMSTIPGDFTVEDVAE